MNGPLKKRIVQDRCKQLYDFFQNWKIWRLANDPRGAIFDPPAVELHAGILMMKSAIANMTSSEDFRMSIPSVFIKFGLLPRISCSSDENVWKEFSVYERKKKGVVISPMFKKIAVVEEDAIRTLDSAISIQISDGSDEEEPEEPVDEDAEDE